MKKVNNLYPPRKASDIIKNIKMDYNRYLETCVKIKKFDECEIIPLSFKDYKKMVEDFLSLQEECPFIIYDQK